MIAGETLLQWPSLTFLIAIVVVAALAHGTLGFGFPVISTPLVALVTDVQTAVLVTLFPNLAVNLISTLRGGEWRQSIARYWPVAIYVLIGTIIGTRVLLVSDPGPIKLLLAAMIVVYLEQKRLRGIDWSWLHRHARVSGAALGLLAGFLSGTVNVALPPLIIYFMALGLAPLAMTQILNLCFLVGRSTQAVSFGISGQVDVSLFVATLSLTVISVVVLAFGIRIQNHIRPEVFQGLLRKVLWLMALSLIVQVLWRRI